jgi:hypothetical protein
MEHVTLDEDGNFSVQESAFLNFMSSGIFLAIFFGVLFTRNFERDSTTGSFFLVYLFLLVGATVFLIKGIRSKTSILINNIGVYFENSLVTEWGNFVNAYIMQEDYRVNSNSAGIYDRFYIVVVFFNIEESLQYTFKIPMSGSQNKSEYEVISAIEYFSGKKLSFDVV